MSDLGPCVSASTIPVPGTLNVAAADLSDGTRNCALPPIELMILNERENQLRPDLPPPLAWLMMTAAERRFLAVVSHTGSLADALARPVCNPDFFSAFREDGRRRYASHE